MAYLGYVGLILISSVSFPDDAPKYECPATLTVMPTWCAWQNSTAWTISPTDLGCKTRAGSHNWSLAAAAAITESFRSVIEPGKITFALASFTEGNFGTAEMIKTEA